MNQLDKQYTDLLQDILDNGHVKKDRTGTGTISVFGRQIRHKMSDGFPLITTKKMYMKGIITELLWFLRGDTNIKYLVDNDCHIWDGDTYKSFEKWKKETDVDIRNKNPTIDFQPLEYESKEVFINKIKTDDDFAEKWGDLGPIYGKQWRSWGGELITKRIKEEGKFPVSQNVMEGEIDQIQNLINDLKTNPDSRRLMVNAWNVGELDQMTLPPCHYGFQVYTRELSLEDRYNWYINIYNKNLTRSSNQFDMDEILNSNNVPTRAISLMWNQRSIDTFLGLPFNIASYGLLLEIIAKEVNMVPDELIGNLGDTHLYLNHIEQAKEQIGRELSTQERLEWVQTNLPNIEVGGFVDNNEYTHKWIDTLGDNIPKHTREPFPLPTLKILDTKVDDISHYEITDFILENYKSHPSIKAPLSN